MLRWVSVAVLALGCLRVLSLEPAHYLMQPPPDALSYMTAADSLAHGDGYEVDVPGFTSTPRYPPGLPLVLVPAVWLAGFPDGAQAGATLITVGLLVMVWFTARRLGGDVAAIVSTVLMATSPFFVATGRVVMSDAFGALLTVGALLALSHGRRLLAGLLVGYSTAVRLSAGVGGLALLATKGRRALAGFVLVVVCLAGFQWVALGSPMGGYGSGGAQFGGSYLLSTGQQSDGDYLVNDDLDLPFQIHQTGIASDPNIVYYPKALLGQWVFMPPLVGLVGMVEVWRRRRTELGRWTIIMCATNVTTFLFYFHQTARFIAPTAALLIVFTGCAVARSVGDELERRPGRATSGVTGDGRCS